MKIVMYMDMDRDTDKGIDIGIDIVTWSRTMKHVGGHGNMDEDMETWTRIWKHG